ncbi:hypothetical protein RhiirA1_436465 [Rhizophagus irregularis]|nr:hypothetical protein GLOIN_2v1847195 [Rhizophagus irregularis DAOM 181602=DAOM 197198]PKC75140.1 hypothetical protein RhiirA1_436465 [Rhizophagus irregularis]POG61155.1 hypothetical protein GLOIN_2v1847195 [Rhizophagus irregularis DAOM 181602=DAOM 197198]CAB4388691.1 unnamed protein product [Rhizophagus irregularis]CAB5369305.1 unnamed protein product [Rhizophagus irregularis]GBC29084.2 hypothetical protein GLOIN_2v1847195 [Rhizophagus irregularis DAOM 181602=DAOM 197198]|eukprot:XP_025168021.1 hypothetical protein GLOIN_2v1847195 [Rhizophagus irregularis DAOM 181602=DAOM 197198]
MNENCAIFNDRTYGPSFGGADLVLRGNSGHCIKDSYEKQIRCPSSESVLHYGATCDCCNYTIRGMGWECTTCEDYDLCHVCKPKSYIHHHPNDHVFELISHSESSDCAPQFAEHDGIMCKCCNKTIHGMRWKCTFCNNYDLCQDCKSKSSNIHDHPNNHAFQPIAYPEFEFDISEPNPTICDYCESSCLLAICQKCANGEFCVEECEIFQVIKR